MRSLALLLLLPLTASAAVVFVGPTRPHTTIQAAVSAASPGDTISIDAGSYPEAVTINKTLTLVGGDDGGAGYHLTAGVLTVNGNFPSSGVSVSPGATITGTGTVGSLILGGGTVSGKLTVLNNVFAGAGAAFQAVISSAADFSKLSAGSTVFLDSNMTLNVSLADGYVPNVGATFAIIPGAVNGTFAGLANGSTLTAGGVTFRINYASATLTVLAAPVSSVPALSNFGLAMLTLTMAATGWMVVRRSV